MKSCTILISVLGFLFYFLSIPARGQSVVPDMIFYNGAILTMEKSQPEAEAIAVRGETIVAVGSNAEILALGTPETQVIDLGGKTLLPGFVDAHTHIFNDAELYWGLSLEQAQQLALKKKPQDCLKLSNLAKTTPTPLIPQPSFNSSWPKLLPSN